MIVRTMYGDCCSVRTSQETAIEALRAQPRSDSRDAELAEAEQVAWRERQGQVREDVRVFLRAVRHPSGRDRLAELRRELTEEFDRLGAAWVIDSQ